MKAGIVSFFFAIFLSISVSYATPLPSIACDNALSIPERAEILSNLQGVKYGIFQKIWIQRFGSGARMSAIVSRERYRRLISEIYNDVDPKLLAKAKTNFKWMANGYLGQQRGGEIGINRMVRSSAAYPLIHAHELQHHYDEMRGLMKNHFLSSVGIKTEVRAYFRTIRAARILFTREELIRMKETEKIQSVKNFVGDIVDFGDDPTEYVLHVLIRFYSEMVYKAVESNDPVEQRQYLLPWIKEALEEN